jgi:tRNA(adenine34) deaminase
VTAEGAYEAAMRLALAAAASVSSDDVPVGAVVLDEAGEVVAAAANRREAFGDPTAHAEVLALRGYCCCARPLPPGVRGGLTG